MTDRELEPTTSDIASANEPIHRQKEAANLSDLPPEVVYEIAKHLPARTDLLRLMKVCKGTLVPAGEILYQRYTADLLNRLLVPLDRLIEGMPHPNPTKEAPFGSALKAKFLRAIRVMVYDILHHTNIFRERALLEGLHPTLTLFVLDRFVVRDRRFQPTEYEFPLALAPHLHTDHFCWYASRDKPFDPPPAGTVGGSDFSHFSEVRFAPGCIPRTFNTHRADIDARILPCYGSLNRVDFSTSRCRLRRMSIDERVEAFVQFFEGLHPELRHASAVTEEETQRRKGTTWEIYQAGVEWDEEEMPISRIVRRQVAESEEVVTRELERRLLERVPELEGRVRFFSGRQEGKWQKPRHCSICDTSLSWL